MLIQSRPSTDITERFTEVKNAMERLDDLITRFEPGIRIRMEMSRLGMNTVCVS
jgi:hypothetical protein